MYEVSMTDLSSLPVDDTAAKLGKWEASDPSFKTASEDLARRQSKVIPQLEEREMAALEKEGDAAKDYLTNLPPPPKPMEFTQQAPQLADYAKQVSPTLMILTAIGGKVAGLSGQNMLGAMQGMLEGTASGNADRFEEAWKQYNNSYEKMKETHNQAQEYWRTMMEYNKDKFGAEQVQAKIVNEMLGIQSQGVQNDYAIMQARDRAFENLETKHQQMQRFAVKARESAANSKVLGLQYDKYNAAKKLKSYADDLKAKWDAMQRAIDRDPSLRTAIDAGTITGADLVNRVNKVAGKEYAEFQNSSARLTGPFLRETLMGIPATALRGVRIEYKEMESLPDITKGYNSTREAVEAVTKMSDAAIQEHGRTYNEMSSRVQSGQSIYPGSVDVGGEPAPAPEPANDGWGDPTVVKK